MHHNRAHDKLNSVLAENYAGVPRPAAGADAGARHAGRRDEQRRARPPEGQQAANGRENQLVDGDCAPRRRQRHVGQTGRLDSRSRRPPRRCGSGRGGGGPLNCRHAITDYKSQGASMQLGQTVIYVPEARKSTYVPLTRSRQASDLLIVSPEPITKDFLNCKPYDEVIDFQKRANKNQARLVREAHSLMEGISDEYLYG